jgi:glycosyltransferase involved in cell wall biosynthesis
MKVSVVCTVLNEEKSIIALLDSLGKQKTKAGEIIIVDGGSTDRTIEIVQHYLKRDRTIKLLVEKCSRAKGRNFGIDIARNQIIAIIDAGCIADTEWLKKITQPFTDKDIDIVAGFYKMIAKNSFQRAASIFLGVFPNKFDIGYQPSARSMAFRKSIWEKLGGFPESMDDTAEDTLFNYKAIKEGVKISRMKNAVVEWGMPRNIKEFFKKIFSYAKGDAKTKIWFYPGKGIKSHNIKSLLVIIRYLLGIFIVYFSIINKVFPTLPIILLIFYSFWAFSKVYQENKNILPSLWGIILQYVSDVGVICGFINGLF